MELREPPGVAPSTPGPDRVARWLLIVNLLALAAVAAVVVWRQASPAPAGSSAELAREVASKLKAAGALDEAAAQYESYLSAAAASPESRANIAYSLGTTYLDRGQYEKALRWFYEAEALGAGSLGEELARKIVHSLERLGRVHAAKAALSSRVQLPDGGDEEVRRPEDDPVVARIGDDEIRRSDVERTLDALPPEVARSLTGAQQRQELLRKFVADELLWRKAQKLEYDEDPEVRRQLELLFKQLMVSRFVEEEVVSKIEVDEADLENYFVANRERYEAAAGGSAQEGQTGGVVTLQQVRPQVERDYRLFKVQSAYRAMVESELAAEDVEMFPERMK